MAKFRDDKMPAIIGQKFEQISDCTNSSIGILAGIQIFGFDVDSDNSFVHFESKIKNSPASGKIDRNKVASFTDGTPIFGNPLFDHGSKST